jgi:hypothetical protein
VLSTTGSLSFYVWGVIVLTMLAPYTFLQLVLAFDVWTRRTRQEGKRRMAAIAAAWIALYDAQSTPGRYHEACRALVAVAVFLPRPIPNEALAFVEAVRTGHAAEAERRAAAIQRSLLDLCEEHASV